MKSEGRPPDIIERGKKIAPRVAKLAFTTHLIFKDPKWDELVSLASKTDYPTHKMYDELEALLTKYNL